MTEFQRIVLEELRYISSGLDELRKDIREVNVSMEALVHRCAEISGRKERESDYRSHVETVPIAPK